MTGNSILQPSRRRMVVQLASLVDLLFVILFLQYMQLRVTAQRQEDAERERSTRAEQAAKNAEETAKSAKEKEKSAKAVTEAAMAGLRKSELQQSEIRRLTEDLNAANNRIKELESKQGEDKRIADKERLDLAEAARKMLGVDIGPALKGNPQTDISALRKELDKLKTASPSQIVQHLRQTVEVQKHCSIWDVHVYADGNVRLRFGETTAKFRPQDENDFADRFCTTAREAGEPKSLVLVLWTFGNAQFSTRESVRKGLDKASLLLKSGWSGHKQIEVASGRFSAIEP